MSLPQPNASAAAPARIVVISDSLQQIPPAMRALEGCGHRIEFVPQLIEFRDVTQRRLAALAEADAIVMGRVMNTGADALDLACRARVIALHTSGSDNVAIDAATERGIVVTNVKGVNAEQCAEFSIGLMLAVTRQIRAGDIAIRAGRWAAETQSSLDLYGATLSVFGLGMIGKAAVRRAAAFGMKILCHTRTPDEAFGAEYGLEYVGKDEALARADVVSLYSSLTPETHHMIGARELGLMQPHAYLINIARGELIDEAALYQALLTRRIAGAGLDVFEREPLYESALFGLENVILTPHQAGLAHSARINAAVRAVNNALAVLDGRLPADAINPSAFTRRPKP